MKTFKYLLLVIVFAINVCVAHTCVYADEKDALVLGYIDNKINVLDEDFYGKYDPDTETWVKPGAFNYEKYPGLAKVQAAAKAGNYSMAKLYALEYYRNEYKNYGYPEPGTATQYDRTYARLLENNIYMNRNSNISLYDTVALGNTPEYISVDFSNHINTILQSPDKLLTIQLMGLRKDGSSFAIESVNSDLGHPPVMEIISKGATHTFTAIEDATISPCDNRNTNFGLEPELYVEESVSSINSPIMVDSQTKKAFIKFNFSGMEASSDVTGATLKLYGCNVGSVGDGEIVITSFPNNAWSEETVTYYKGNAGEIEHSIFSSYGLDSILFTNSYERDMDNEYYAASYRYPEDLLRFDFSAVLTRLYISDRENGDAYAYELIRQWIGFLNQRGNHPRFIKSLDSASRIINLVPNLVEMIDSEYMTPDIWSATLKYFYVEGNTCLQQADYNNNWRTFQVRSMACLITFFKEFSNHKDWVERAQWLAETNIRTMLFDDGTIVEAAMGYAAGSLNMMMTHDEYLKYSGLDKEESILNDAMKKLAHKGLIGVKDILMPGYTDMQWGDGGNYKTSYKDILAFGGRVFSDPYLLYAGTDGKEGKKPEDKSAYYPLHGRFAMRTGYDQEKDLYLFIDNDGAGSSHPHRDDNAVIVYAYGQYLLVDPLYYSYSYSTATNITTVADHNTITINNVNQNAGAGVGVGETFREEINDSYDNLTISTKTYDYIGVSHRRNILFIKPNYWIINDYLVPNDKNATNNYKQHWHMLPEANISLDEELFKGRSNFDGSANIQIVQANLDNMILPTLQDGYFSMGNNTLYDAKYLRFEKEGSGNELFNTVVYPEKKGEKADIEAIAIPLTDVKDNGATAMNVRIDSDVSYIDADYYLLHDEKQKATRSFGNYITDGRMTYIAKNKVDNITSIILQDASEIKDKERDVILYKSNSPIKELSVDFNYYQVCISSSQDLDLENMTFYSENPVTEVLLNGNRISFKTAGKYIYFGEEPILESEAYEPDVGKKPTGGNGDSHASTGGKPGSGLVKVPQQTAGNGTTVTDNVNVEKEPNNEINDSYLAELENHWGKDELISMINSGIIKGIDDNTLGLKNETTKAQFVVLLMRALGEKEQQYGNQFKDVKLNDWFSGYLEAATNLGIIAGDGNGYFNPEAPITREQMAKILVCTYENITDSEIGLVKNSFADDGDISDWATEYVYKARAAELVYGNDQNEFLPINALLRDEAAISVYRIKNKFETANK